jgi:hypothetical protein
VVVIVNLSSMIAAMSFPVLRRSRVAQRRPEAGRQQERQPGPTPPTTFHLPQHVFLLVPLKFARVGTSDMSIGRFAPRVFVVSIVTGIPRLDRWERNRDAE